MNRKKSTYEERRKRIVRILCFVLAALMVVGSLYTLIYMLIVAASAADPSKDDITLRVGLMYGDGVTVGFETTTPAGYEIGVQPLTDGTYQYRPFWTIPTKKVSVTADDNLSKKDSTYSITPFPTDVVIGGFHIELVLLILCALVMIRYINNGSHILLVVEQFLWKEPSRWFL